MKSKIETVEYVCDGCRKSKVVREVDGLPKGIHGTASEQHEGGGCTESAEFYACSTRCIGKAVQNAIEAASKEGSTDPAQTAEDLAEERAHLAEVRGYPTEEDADDEIEDDDTPALAR